MQPKPAHDVASQVVAVSPRGGGPSILPCWTTSMETVSGMVTGFDGRDTTVMVDSQPDCPRCRAGSGCGAGIMQSRNKLSTVRITVPSQYSVAVGDVVTLAIDANNLLRATLYAYGCPLVASIVFLMGGRVLLGPTGDLAGVLLAATGLVVGLLLSRRLLRRESVRARLIPRLVRTP